MDMKLNTKACLFLVVAQLVPVMKYKPSIHNNANTRKYKSMHKITMVQYSDSLTSKLSLLSGKMSLMGKPENVILL
jgi:hypothetical protein